MSRDSLNRCLLDGASVKWFNVHMVTLESLIEMAPSELRHLPVFAQYQDKSLENSYFFGSAELSEPRAIKSLHLQKIGFIAVKQTILEIYNLQLQISIEHTAKEGARSRPMVVTLGNLNVTGISD
jgi:hypothetical protein